MAPPASLPNCNLAVAPVPAVSLLTVSIVSLFWSSWISTLVVGVAVPIPILSVDASTKNKFASPLPSILKSTSALDSLNVIPQHVLVYGNHFDTYFRKQKFIPYSCSFWKYLN